VKRDSCFARNDSSALWVLGSSTRGPIEGEAGFGKANAADGIPGGMG